jgi:hypothetical protein
MIKHWDKSTLAVFLAAAVIFAAYLPVALWLKHAYVPMPAPPGQVMPLFRVYQATGFSFNSPLEYRFLPFADEMQEAQHSPVLLYENDKLLGPAHSSTVDIKNLGSGRYAHLKGRGLIFSTSDNSDPNTNGRNYWVVLPKP